MEVPHYFNFKIYVPTIRQVCSTLSPPPSFLVSPVALLFCQASQGLTILESFFSFLQGSSRSLQSVAQLLLWEVNALLSSSHLFSEWFLLLLSSLLSSLHEGELILLLFGRGQKKEIWHRLNMYYVSMTDINSL